MARVFGHPHVVALNTPINKFDKHVDTDDVKIYCKICTNSCHLTCSSVELFRKLALTNRGIQWYHYQEKLLTWLILMWLTYGPLVPVVTDLLLETGSTNPTMHQSHIQHLFCNRYVHTCTHFSYKMYICGVFLWCIVGQFELGILIGVLNK